MFPLKATPLQMVCSAALIFVGATIGYSLVHAPLGAAEPQPSASDSTRPGTKDSKVKELMKERLATLRELVRLTTAEYNAGRASFDRLHQAIRAVLDAELEQCQSDKERIAVLGKTLALAKESENNALQRYKSGAATHSDVLMATAARLETEIALERAKSK
jgi:outer membrane protein TolC